MKNSKEVLSSILKTTQMGQLGIRTVQEYATAADLKQALSSQLKEYDAIEDQAHNIANQRGWELEELHPVAKSMARMSARTRLRSGDIDSKIAAMMVTGNARGVVKTLKNAHRYHERDNSINELSQKLVSCENANIRQMENFL